MLAILLPLFVMSDPVPIAGRPADFSGAVGGPFVVTTKLDKTEFPKEHWVQLTVTITGPGDLSKVELPDLNKDKAWSSRFQIHERPNDSPSSEQNTKSFVFHLRVRNHDVHDVPPLKFTYFNPAIRPPTKGWQTTYSEPIAIVVQLPHPLHRNDDPKLRKWLARLLSPENHGSNLHPIVISVAQKIGWTDLIRQRILRLRMISEMQAILTSRQTISNLALGIASSSRATRMWPWDRIFEEGLDLLRTHVAYPEDTADSSRLKPETQLWPNCLFQPWLSLVSVTAWAGILVFVVKKVWANIGRRSMPCAPFAQPAISSPGVAIAKILGIMVLLACALLPAFNFGVKKYRANRDGASPPVVIHKDSPLREGNGFDYPIKLSLPCGVEARRIAHRNEWTQIEFASGLVGWVPDNVLLFVFPQPHAP